MIYDFNLDNDLVKPYFGRLGFAVDQRLFFSAEVDMET